MPDWDKTQFKVMDAMLDQELEFEDIIRVMPDIDKSDLINYYIRRKEIS